MRSRPLNTCLICMCFLIYSSALPRAKDYRPMSSEYVSGSGNVANAASTTNIGTYSKEPSCEELRAMWRFSKRQSRAAEITNEIPTYRDPFAFNVWEEYAARPRSAGRGFGRYRKPPVYGKVVHSTYLRTPENLPERVRAFEEVARLFGTAAHPAVPRRKTSFRFGGGTAPLPNLQIHPSQAGSFQHLKELIRSERARELQEQRLSEQADRGVMKAMDKVQYGRMNEKPSVPAENNVHNERSMQSLGVQNKGIVAFPDILVPASYKYMDDYIYPATQIATHKYKQRYPDTNSASISGSHDRAGP